MDSEFPFVLSVSFVAAVLYLAWAKWHKELFLRVLSVRVSEMSTSS